MRFAFKNAPQHTPWADMLALWQEGDQIELFESAWSFDHFYPIVGDSNGPCLEGWTTLAALAQATTRLRVGLMVTGIHYRHPAVLANMASAIDVISGGRLELGIGAGWNEQESGAYGIDLGTPRERSDRFEEGCEVLVSLLSQEWTTFEGTYYQLKDARNEPKGPQRPHPPICIGGAGEKRTLRTAARFAQHWNYGGGTPDEFARKRDILYGHCADIGAIRRRSRCRATSSSAPTARSVRRSRPPRPSRNAASTWPSSTFARPSIRAFWRPWPKQRANWPERSRAQSSAVERSRARSNPLADGRPGQRIESIKSSRSAAVVCGLTIANRVQGRPR